MSVSVIADILSEGLDARESGGVLQECRRVFLVSGLSVPSSQILLSALATVGVPQYGDPLPGNPQLFAAERAARLVPGSQSDVYVDVVYRRSVGAAPDATGVRFVRGDSSLAQVTSRRDRNGVIVKTSHTYPPDDENFPGKTIEHGNQEFEALEPQARIEAAGIIATFYPEAVRRRWLGKINSRTWNGDDPGTWLCSSVSFDAHDLAASIPEWEFSFEFQHNPRGWQPEVWFVDEFNPDKPLDLVAGVGYRRVDWYYEDDFNELLWQTI